MRSHESLPASTRLGAMVLQLCVISMSLGIVTGCQDPPQSEEKLVPATDQGATGGPMTAAEMAAMAPSTPVASPEGDGMTPEEMARMPLQTSVSGGELDIAPERLQVIGVRFERAARRSLNREIRTVGQVAIDERRLARVNLKIEGWIDQLMVNTTGQRVTRGQPLFSLYSPDLVATQEEYLLALRSAQTLGESEYPEVAQGAKAGLEAARRRPQLWGLPDSNVREPERTGPVRAWARSTGSAARRLTVAGSGPRAG